MSVIINFISSITVKHLIAKFPLTTCPGGNVETYELDGITLTKHFYPPSTIDAMKKWEARPEDIFVITYPRAGK